MELRRENSIPDVRRSDDDFDLTLQTCPFASAALSDPDTVCQLHLGLAQGIAESVGGIRVDELIPKDPRRARCRLRGRLSVGGRRRIRFACGKVEAAQVWRPTAGGG